MESKGNKVVFNTDEMIECIDSSDCYLTKGKVYTVEYLNKQGHPYVKNDHGYIEWYGMQRFKKVKGE
jgi:hypothetical protein